ncbi:MAG: FkbM family methyltransferase [Candidatus Omnitrophica bacterium]|nr:FkbM family methyltransferase [Candidatus Omnitrophota bacterium]
MDAEVQRYKQTKEIINVKCEPLEDVLRKYNITKIDLCNIDIEGGELDILKSIDFTTINIKMFVVENPYEVKKMRDFMESRGYVLIKTLGCDDVYQLQDAPPLKS